MVVIQYLAVLQPLSVAGQVVLALVFLAVLAAAEGFLATPEAQELRGRETVGVLEVVGQLLEAGVALALLAQVMAVVLLVERAVMELPAAYLAPVLLTLVAAVVAEVAVAAQAVRVVVRRVLLVALQQQQL